MNSPLSYEAQYLAKPGTRAAFWHERKWYWLVDTLLFAALAAASAWPIVAAGSAVLTILQQCVA